MERPHGGPRLLKNQPTYSSSQGPLWQLFFVFGLQPLTSLELSLEDLICELFHAPSEANMGAKKTLQHLLFAACKQKGPMMSEEEPVHSQKHPIFGF